MLELALPATIRPVMMGPISWMMVRPTMVGIYDSAPNCTMVGRSRNVSTNP